MLAVLRLGAGAAVGAASAAAGAAGWVASQAAARPAPFAGAASFLALVCVVAGNAFFAQPHGHPQPMLATRGGDAASATASAAAEPATPAVPAWRPINDPRIMPVPMVRDVQLMLAETGHYASDIDGRPGQATDRAIRSFQTEHGLRVDGMATPLLLTQIRQASGLVPSPDGRPEEVAAADVGTDSAIETGGVTSESLSGEELVRRIQAELNAASVAELKADGILGERTRAAIRTFQALEGMEVTGEPTPPLLSRLQEIGSRS